MEDSASSVISLWASLNSWFTPTVFFLLLNLMIATIVFTSNLPDNHQQDQKQNHPNQPKIARSPSILHRLKSFNFYPHRSEHEFPPTTHHQQALQLAATQYVFNHPLHHDHHVPTLSAHNSHFDFDSTPSDQVAVTAAAQYSAFDQAVETVTNHFHFDFDPTHQENQENTGFEDTHEEQNQELESLDEVYSRLNVGHVNRTKSDTRPASGEVPRKLPAKMKKSASLKSAFSYFEEEKIVEARGPATVRERKPAARVEEDDVEVDARADDFINKFKNDLKLQRIESIIRSKGGASRGTAM